MARGTRVLDDPGVTLSGNLEGLVGCRGTSLLLSGLGNQGRSPSEFIGDAHTVSNIEAPNSRRLYEAWIDQNFRREPLSLKDGLYEKNSEFDVKGAASVFVNSCQGTGPESSQTGPHGPSVSFRAGLADSRWNQFGSSLAGSLAYTGLLAGRDGDRVGLAVAAAISGEE